MTLRRLIFLILLPVVAVTASGVFFYFKLNFACRLATIEERYLMQQEKTVFASTEKYITGLGITVKNWAYWDDSYNFIQKRSEVFEHVLSSTLLAKTGADAAFMLDDAMNTVYAVSANNLPDTPESIAATVKNSKNLIDKLSNERLNSFFLQPKNSETLYLGVFARITNTDMTAPPYGYFVLLQSLDTFMEGAFIKSGLEMPSVSQDLAPKDSDGKVFASARKNGNFSEIVISLPVLDSRRAVFLTFKHERDIFASMDRAVRFSTFAMVLVAVFSAFSVAFLTDYFILKRIRLFSADFKDIKFSPDFDKRLPETGSYEIVQMAQTANSALDDIKNLNKKLMMMTNIDGLTGIPNRRFFDVSFEKEFRRAMRNNLEISVLIIDIDFFKRFNDNYGHLNGDECLKTVASIISRTLQRPADFAARMGGEEFVIILPETGKDGAKHIAETIRKAVAETPVRLIDTGNVFITISIGISTTMPDKLTCKESLIEKADLAMYTAKRIRNCTKHFGENIQEE